MEKHNSATAVLISAAWCGLLAGLLEGAAFLRFPLLRNPDLPWIAVLFDLAIFLILGCGFALLSKSVPRRALLALANCVFFLVMFYDCATVGVGDHARRVLLRVVALLLAAALGLAVWKFTARWEALQRRTLAVLALFALLYTGLPPLLRALHERRQLAQVSTANSSPNVLVIVVDALRADHLSTYGYARNTSPYLTQMAARGVQFRDAVAAAPWTLPSHASLLTGRLPHEHGADRPDSFLDGRLPTLAEAFRDRGYRTAAFSANWWFFARRLGFGRGFMHFEDFNSLPSALAQTNMGQRLQNLLLKLKLLRTAIGRSRAPAMNRHLLRWLDHSHGPFFIVANYMDVHEPYLPPLPCFHRFSGLARPRGTVFVGNPEVATMTAAQVQDELDAYDASVYCLDAQIAQLEQALEKRGLLRNTILVFTSDHGDGLYEHKLMGHGNSLYWELIHVPLVIAGPGIPAGVTVDRPVSLTWLPRTLLTLAGGNPGSFPGVTMEQAWSGTPSPSWPYPLSELRAMYMDPRAPNYSHDLQSLTTPAWHLIIMGGKEREELYDYGADPRESHNLDSTKQALTGVLKLELQRELSAPNAPAMVSTPGNPWPTNSARPLSDRSRSRQDQARERQRSDDYLKALGYAPK